MISEIFSSMIFFQYGKIQKQKKVKISIYFLFFYSLYYLISLILLNLYLR